jgi:hypothetical protein
MVPLDRVPMQYGGGGQFETEFAFTRERWLEICDLFSPQPENSHEERERICLAIAVMERTAGEQSPTWMDKPMNGEHGPRERGQQDCIDESTNTTMYLRVLRERGLMRYHKEVECVWRAPWLLDTHRTAVVEDVTDGRRYVIDSWFGHNGDRALTQPLEDWLAKKPLPGRDELVGSRDASGDR